MKRLLCMCLVLAGCASAGEAEFTEKACESTCATLGETRCDGAVVEGCVVDDAGCMQWIRGLDCSESGAFCDDATQPAVCMLESGTCEDGVHNQDESDVDCGGARCEPCRIGLACEAAEDCISNNCDVGATDVCVLVDIPTCTDQQQNADETDVDCGGVLCPACPAGAYCVAGRDCDSGVCDSGTCVDVVATCDDGLLNQDESDVDCGGDACAACADAQLCEAASDCQSNNCDSGASGRCVSIDTPTCGDGVHNQDETDIDCGGQSCAACELGQGCTQANDCAQGVCDFVSTGTCVDLTPQHEVNEDFESGDFSTFPYAFQSDSEDAHHWVLETIASQCHGGDFCARTNPEHALQETSSFEISVSVREDATIAFWAKLNTEPEHHMFRFYIDGELQEELSGQLPWTLYSYPVKATGPNGPNRVFRWEFYRSDYVDPNHTPWFEVWIDDIDMPTWNSEPTTPELLKPWNGKLTRNATPTFEWRSFDPDFDTITYEMQYDTDSAFSNPVSTGEINERSHTPSASLDDNDVYYWRVRAKDDSNYRWSDWSAVSAVEIDTQFALPAAWRQTERAQFEMSDFEELNFSDEAVINTKGQMFSRTIGPIEQTSAYENLEAEFTGLPQPEDEFVASWVSVGVAGDYRGSLRYLYLRPGHLGGGYLELGSFRPNGCGGPHQSPKFSGGSVLPIDLKDGKVKLSWGTGIADYEQCGGSRTTFTIEYAIIPERTIISTPINFELFDGKTHWEKVQWQGEGEIRVQILDADGALIPDGVVAGNSEGFTERTVHLWNVDRRTYPVIKLKATMPRDSRLDEWVVTANDVYEWTFSRDGDLEGWQPFDSPNATPSLSVVDGVLRFESSAEGTNPGVLYTFDPPVEASRFSTLEVRLRVSDIDHEHDAKLYWQSNFGLFDDRRSVTIENQVLIVYQDLTFDLTQAPTSPGEPWQGLIEAIRLDPVAQFLDQSDNSMEGWFEIERIAIY